jgi:4-hydroxy-tetrahydrodipicolinate synthase
VPCGTTGESPTLTDAERTRTVEILVDEAGGRVPVLPAPAATTRRRSSTRLMRCGVPAPRASCR